MPLISQIKKILDPAGLILSLPMIAMLLMTFVFAPKHHTNHENNIFLAFWLIMFILTLPWSIPILGAGFIAAFSQNTWWGYPLFILAIICAIIAAHANAIIIISLFSRKSKIQPLEKMYVSNPDANRQIITIIKMHESGISRSGISSNLNNSNQRYLADGTAWSEEKVSEIINLFHKKTRTPN